MTHYLRKIVNNISIKIRSSIYALYLFTALYQFDVVGVILEPLPKHIKPPGAVNPTL